MILIINCGSQLTQNIAKRVREKNVYCEIKPYNSITAKNIINNTNYSDNFEGMYFRKDIGWRAI